MLLKVIQCLHKSEISTFNGDSFFKEKTGKGCKKSEDVSDEGKKLSNVTIEHITVWSRDIKTNEKIAPLKSDKKR